MKARASRLYESTEEELKRAHNAGRQAYRTGEDCPFTGELAEAWEDGVNEASWDDYEGHEEHESDCSTI